MQTVKAQHQLKQSTVAGLKHVVVITKTIGVGVARTQQTDVPVGARLSGIVCNLNWIVPSGSGTANIDFYIMQRRSGQSDADIPFADWSSIGTSDVRNQIFHSDINLTGTEDAGPLRRMFRLKIPKRFQRCRDGDEWILVYDTSENTSDSLGFRFKWKL
jgi:hypothetical protein